MCLACRRSKPLGERLPLVSLIPFVALLVAIALLPVFSGSWWEANANKGKVAALFALPLAGLMVFHFGLTGLEAIVERLFEYISLIALLGSLFVVCGGILVEGTPKGSPAVNTGLLALGAVLSNIIGTTGASMILIRPLIRANQHRQRLAHVPIFLIFIVANCGGLLTPLGDPPLFLGYLAGVAFGWTLKLFPVWALVNGALLAIFYVWDWRAFRREKPVSSAMKPEIGVPESARFPDSSTARAWPSQRLATRGHRGHCLCGRSRFGPWRQAVVLRDTRSVTGGFCPRLNLVHAGHRP